MTIKSAFPNFTLRIIFCFSNETCIFPEKIQKCTSKNVECMGKFRPRYRLLGLISQQPFTLSQLFLQFCRSRGLYYLTLKAFSFSTTFIFNVLCDFKGEEARNSFCQSKYFYINFGSNDGHKRNFVISGPFLAEI